jgi:hypothetical protein
MHWGESLMIKYALQHLADHRPIARHHRDLPGDVSLAGDHYGDTPPGKPATHSMQVPLAGLAVLQVDHATSAHQALPGHHQAWQTRIRCAVATHMLIAIVKKATSTRGLAPDMPANLVSLGLRKHRCFMRLATQSIPTQSTHRRQPVDSVRLLTGPSCDVRHVQSLRNTTEPQVSGSSTGNSGLPSRNRLTAREQAEFDSGLL